MEKKGRSREVSRKSEVGSLKSEDSPAADRPAPTEPQTENRPQQTEQMEVHHHPDLHHEKKPWKEYILEFVMIFLAVTMGFFAESLRESISEKANAKEFLETYRNELVQQQRDFDAYNKIFHKKIDYCDSLVQIFNEGRENKDLNVVGRLLIFGKRITYIPTNTSAYDQMISSGTLRYIKNIPLRDSMAYYKSMMDNLKNYNTQINLMLLSGELEVQKLEDIHNAVAKDTGSYTNLLTHKVVMKPYPVMTERERRYLVGYYEDYVISAASSINKLYALKKRNHALLILVNRELDK
jgi:hypothetical protein